MKNIIYLFLFSVMLMGCAHQHKLVEPAEHATETLKVSIGAKEVKINDIVAVSITKCHDAIKARGIKNKGCENIKVGEARVVEVLDDEHSLIVPLNGLKFTQEMKVEKTR